VEGGRLVGVVVEVRRDEMRIRIGIRMKITISGVNV
jgi:hypothetical protein